MADRPEPAMGAPATASHASARKPSPKAARRGTSDVADNVVQNGLDACAEVPLHVRPVLDYAELEALGVIPERSLRRLVATGRVKRAVLRLGRRVRFVMQDLLDELRQAGE